MVDHWGSGWSRSGGVSGGRVAASLGTWLLTRGSGQLQLQLPLLDRGTRAAVAQPPARWLSKCPAPSCVHTTRECECRTFSCVATNCGIHV